MSLRKKRVYWSPIFLLNALGLRLQGSVAYWVFSTGKYLAGNEIPGKRGLAEWNMLSM